MRRILFLTCLVFAANMLYSQTTVQGTIVNTSPNRLSVYAKPNVALSGRLFRAILVTLSIQDQSGSGGNPAVSLDSNFIPNMDWQTVPVVVSGGRAFYNFSATDNGGTTTTSWSTGNNKVATFTFSNSNGFNTAQLNDLTGDAVNGEGGPNGQMYWYVEILGAGGGDITNYTAKFYGTNPPPVNSQTLPSFVGEQSMSLLPIALRDFNVSKQGTGNALLTWTTSFEQNASHFVVERSVKQTDNWAPIAQVKAKGNSTIDTKYEYTDANVYDGREVNKTVFYRLKEVDLDGGEKVFPVRSLKFSALGDKEITIFPNPARTGFYVQIPILFRAEQKLRLNLVNRLGQVVDTREISTAVASNYYYDISSPSITSGDYALDIIYDGQKLATKKILVNR